MKNMFVGDVWANTVYIYIILYIYIFIYIICTYITYNILASDFKTDAPQRLEYFSGVEPPTRRTHPVLCASNHLW